MSVKKMTHKGKPYLYADFRGQLKPEQQIQTLEELVLFLKAAAVPLGILSNFEGISLGTEFMNRVKTLGKEYDSKISHQALLGITGLKNVLLQGYITFTGAKSIKAFDKEGDALDWLVS